MRLKLLAAAVILSTSVGCAALSRLLAGAFVTPKLTFQRATLAGIDLDSATLNLEYLIENPNPVGIELVELQYALFVEGRQVVTGTPPSGLRIAANGQSTVVLPANLEFADLAPTLLTFLEKDTAKYRAEGSLGLSSPLGIVRLPLQKEGEFEVPKVPEVEFQAPRITQLSFASATIELPFTLKNRNTYPLPLGGLAGALSLSGATIGSINTGDLGLMAGKDGKKVTIPLTIQFMQAASAAMAVRNGKGTIAFDGELISGASRVPLKFSQNVEFMR